MESCDSSIAQSYLYCSSRTVAVLLLKAFERTNYSTELSTEVEETRRCTLEIHFCTQDNVQKTMSNLTQQIWDYIYRARGT